jgi:hypothetical protein
MGFTMSAELHAKLEANRAAGRLCGGATRSRAGCSQPAVVRVITADDLAGKTYGPTVLCRKHGQQDYAQVGFAYANGPAVVSREDF